MRRLAATAALVAFATLAVSPPSLAQEAIRIVGVLALGNPDPARFIREFKAGMAELGHAEGQNVRYEIRSAEGNASRLRDLARELTAIKVDVLLAYQTPAASAAKAATQALPIVLASVADPVASGLVQSLSHPGGNITGTSGATSELVVKNLELVKDVIPSVRRVAIIANEPDPFHKILIAQTQAAADQLKIEIKVVLAKAGDDFELHFRTIKSWGADAALIQPSLPLREVAQAAARNKLPALCPNENFIEAGGLMSYSSDQTSLHKQVATMVDKVLKGRKPADLPVEMSTKFRLTINAKVAAAIGLTISPLLLARADEVIE